MPRVTSKFKIYHKADLHRATIDNIMRAGGGGGGRGRSTAREDLLLACGPLTENLLINLPQIIQVTPAFTEIASPASTEKPINRQVNKMVLYRLAKYK